MISALKKNRKTIIVFSLLILAEVFVLYYPLDYLVYFGGTATDLDPYVQVLNMESVDQGSYYMLSVHTSQANGALWLRSLFNKEMDLVPTENRIPQGMDMEEYNNLMLEMMAESQKKATLMALKLGGFDYEVKGGGLKISGFTENSLLSDVLQEDDVIKSFAGREVLMNEELQPLLALYSPGDQIEIGVERQGELLYFSGPLTQDEAGNAKMGVYVTNTSFELTHDFEISFDNQKIGGSSAGMMLTLQILDKLLPEDLSKGYGIAGTGTIRLDGSIGPIEGVKQKVKAAEDAHAIYLLVASENAAEAALYAKSIKVIPITNIDEAVAFLRALDSK